MNKIYVIGVLGLMMSVCIQAERATFQFNNMLNNSVRVRMLTSFNDQGQVTVSPRQTKAIEFPDLSDSESIQELIVEEIDPRGNVLSTEVWFAGKKNRAIPNATIFEDYYTKINRGTFVINRQSTRTGKNPVNNYL